jgi:hypothetical protein
MKGKARPILVVLALITLLGCGQGSTSGRTQYESLDLSSPEAAVRTFGDLFRREDFVGVYMVLSPLAQRHWQMKFSLFLHKEMVRTDVWTDFPEGAGLFPIEEAEHQPDGWFAFDQIMLTAKERSALLIDLSGKITVADSQDSKTVDGDAAVDVTARVEGIEGEVIFRMVQAPSGRWRVFQVVVPGGDEEIVPWAVPGAGD